MDANFQSMVVQGGADDCWPWIGARDRHGYGQLKRGRRMLKAHRIAAEIAGLRVTGLCVCHTCDNPPCCNPSHLFVGTHADNAADRNRKGRTVLASQVGSLNGNARLTEDDVRAIRRAGGTNTAVAAEFGVTHQMISKIRARKAWKHVE